MARRPKGRRAKARVRGNEGRLMVCWMSDVVGKLTARCTAHSVEALFIALSLPASHHMVWIQPFTGLFSVTFMSDKFTSTVLSFANALSGTYPRIPLILSRLPVSTPPSNTTFEHVA